MREIPDAYTAICGILLPHMRLYAEIRKLLQAVIQFYLYVNIRFSTLFIIRRYTIVSK